MEEVSETKHSHVDESRRCAEELHDAGKTLRYMNPQYEAMLGYSPEEGVSHPEHWIEIIHPEDRERVIAEDERTDETLEPFRAEYRVFARDGRIVWVRDEAVAVRDEEGNPLFWQGVMFDITERKKAEETLTESERRFTTVLSNTHAYVYRCLNEPGWPNEFASDYALELTGHEPEDLLVGGKVRFGELIVEEDRQRVWEEVQAALAKRERFELRYTIRRRDGEIRHVEEFGQGIYDEEGEVVALEGIVYDVTERERTEAKLREAEERYRSLVERIPAITYIDLADGWDTPLYTSPQVEQMLGYTPEEWMANRMWLKRLHPDDKERVLAADERFEVEGESFSEEYRLFARDGRVVWVREDAVVVRDEAGEPLYWQGVIFDITEQKLAQEALQSSEARFRSVVESVGEGLLITDTDDAVMYANPRMTELTGYAEEEMLGRPAYELLLPPERWPDLLERNRERIEGLAERYEIQLKRKDGSPFWAEINATPYHDATGEIIGTLGAITDVTERRRTERALRESEHRFRQLFEQSVDAIFVHDEKGRFVDCNPRACQLLGYTREELLDLSVREISLGLLTEGERAARERSGGTLWQRALAGEPGTFAFSHEEENRRNGGTIFPVEVRVGSVDYGGRRMILASVRDITERKQAEESLRESEERHRRQAQELSLLYRVSTAVAQELDLSVVLRTVVDDLAQTFGYALVSAYLLEDDVLALQHQVGYDQVIKRIPITEGVSGRVVRTGEHVLLEDVQEDPDFLAAVEGITSEICVPLLDQDEIAGVLNVESTGGVTLTQADLRMVSVLAEQVDGAIERARLYTQVRESEEQLTYRAFHDPLTGLANRALFLNRLEHAQVRAKRQAGKLAMLFMDLDNFKVINDSLGHGAGDRLLIAVAERLRTCVRPQDTVARLGGDEFVALLEDLTNANDAVRVAERVMEELRAPFDIDGHSLHTSASIGIALDATHDGDLLRAADTAMYRAKESGKGRYEMFEEAMHDRALERLRLENDLRSALGQGEFTVYYQPKFELRTGRVTGVEALLRWRHPEYGLLSPRDFMPLAEQTELIVPIGRWVLLETCRQARAWQEHRSDDEPLAVCVNLSVTQLRKTDFIGEVLSETGLDPSHLVLEITEYAVMEDAQSTIAALEKLKGSGLKLAIDNFGTGYSSLSHLRRLPVDFLKIDRSFIERLGEDSRDTEIVSGTIDLAHTLGLKTIAEGVETAVQLERLREMGCDLAQGNYFSKPLDAADLKRYLEID